MHAKIRVPVLFYYYLQQYQRKDLMAINVRKPMISFIIMREDQLLKLGEKNLKS